FGARFVDESHRARLRVEIGRLRRMLRPLTTITATRRGFALKPRSRSEVVVLARPVEEEHGAVLAFLADGESWSSSALALALGASQRTVQRALDEVAAHAGTAFDGKYLYQIAEDHIHKIDPKSGQVVATIPAPGGGGDSGLAWAEGMLWVGEYRNRKIHQVNPETGAILRTIESNR